ILALRRIIEDTRNHQKEAAIIFIDFKKAFDSVDRNKLFQILQAYGIPEKIAKAIQIMLRAVAPPFVAHISSNSRRRAERESDNVTCGGGSRNRDRGLCCNTDWSSEQCLSNRGLSRSGAGDRSGCNENCIHGSYSSGQCQCGPANYGYCCQSTVTCGQPSSPVNGFVTGSNYEYGHAISYSCLEKYNLTNGDVTRTCQSSNGYGQWSGSKPTCAYAKHCESDPCQNAATCVDGLDRYDCTCAYGWSGTVCEMDILPPDVFNCSSNETYIISSPKVMLTWQEPSFNDPRGTAIQVSQNYQKNEATFPWGEFIIQFVATKPSNGLRTECLFTESVHPTPCGPLVAPDNGALACNGWNGRFGEVCTVLCEEHWDLPPGNDISRLYVCGASGQWIPSLDVFACSEPYLAGDDLDTEANRHYYSGDCDDKRVQIGEKYIAILMATDMREMCTSWDESCVPEKANVVCGNTTVV
ncbi:hypothetical protein LSAT2_021414, partial [Lamellibrachia satsuma]